MTAEAFASPECNRPEKATFKRNLCTIFQNEEWFGKENGIAIAIAEFVEFFSHVSLSSKRGKKLHELTDLFVEAINRGTLTVEELGDALFLGALALPSYFPPVKIALLGCSPMRDAPLICANKSACRLNLESQQSFIEAIEKVIPEHPSNVSLSDIFRFRTH